MAYGNIISKHQNTLKKLLKIIFSKHKWSIFRFGQFYKCQISMKKQQKHVPAE